MSIPISQRAAYTTAQVCRLFGRSDGAGNVIPLHPNTIHRWRKSGAIPWFKITGRTLRYPRAQIDAILESHRETVSRKAEDEWHASREGELKGMYTL